MISNEDNPSCPEDNRQLDGRCIYHTKLTISGTGPFSFTNTDFLRCSNSGNGGAILFRNQASGTLTVSHCTFNSCTCNLPGGEQDGNGGGAIYAKFVSKVEVFSSFFLSCACYSLTLCDGGGIELYYILSQPLINECTFAFGHADDDGGGVAIWNSNADDPLICKDSFFLNCECGEGGGGGGLAMWLNTATFKCANILFSCNQATTGGACSTDCQHSDPNFLLWFCFFNRNTGRYGNDACFCYQPSNSPSKHCFSTSDQNRIAFYSGSSWYTTEVNWLPQTNINTSLIATIFEPRYSLFVLSAHTSIINDPILSQLDGISTRMWNVHHCMESTIILSMLFCVQA